GALVVAFTVPRIRRPIAARIAEARPALAVIRSPIKLAGLLGGNFVAQLLLAIVLGLTVRAFGQSATLAELLLTNTLVSLFAGVMPIPGGIGVSEAASGFSLPPRGRPGAAGGGARPRLPPADVLPAADLGRVRDAVAPQAGVPVGGAAQAAER